MASENIEKGEESWEAVDIEGMQADARGRKGTI
jgi:hypothetical protein